MQKGGEIVMAKGKYQDWLTDDGLLVLEAWARDGLTDEQISANIGINVKTLYDWKNKHSNICNALKRGKEIVDVQVENALFKRAIGYSYTETTRERMTDYDPETGIPAGSHMKVTKEVVKEVVPDTTAQIFWLKNRKPESWRDKKDVEHSGEINNPFAGLTTDELRRLAGVSDDDD